jgi:murein DD-endopeptidase MepM/ murein hydrolase activator NlpD
MPDNLGPAQQATSRPSRKRSRKKSARAAASPPKAPPPSFLLALAAGGPFYLAAAALLACCLQTRWVASFPALEAMPPPAYRGPRVSAAEILSLPMSARYRTLYVLEESEGWPPAGAQPSSQAPSGEAPGAWIWPVASQTVTSHFGQRSHPFDGLLTQHKGVDVRAATGDAVVAAASGVVRTAGSSFTGGRMVRVDHGDGVETAYLHLSRIEVNEGQRVRAGEPIGRAGSTGLSTGPHLHFELWVDGQAQDPLRYRYRSGPFASRLRLSQGALAAR